MKKLVFILLLCLLGIGNVFASDKIKVQFSDCIDGDTAKLILNNEVIKIRLLGIDTPESVHPNKPVEFYGKKASEYTCNNLKKSNNIEIEYDDNSDKLDKYNRHLVWLYIDNKLFNKELVENGYAEIAYLYGNYKYTYLLEEAQIIAKINKIGIWSNEKSIDYKFIVTTIVLLIILYILYKNKLINKKQFKKVLKKIGN